MTRRSMIWLVVALVFLVVNAAGAGMALAGGELLHACLHAALLLPGAYLVRRLLAPAGYAAGRGRRSERETAALPGELTARLTHLEQSLDAAAIEIERIGEGQRFMTRLFTEDVTARQQRE